MQDALRGLGGIGFPELLIIFSVFTIFRHSIDSSLFDLPKGGLLTVVGPSVSGSHCEHCLALVPRLGPMASLAQRRNKCDWRLATLLIIAEARVARKIFPR